MKTVDEWKALLRTRLREALGAKDKHALAVLRETLSAIDNAEAVPTSSEPVSNGGAFAGSVEGLGAGEVARRVLSPEETVALIEREIRERREAAAAYVGLGRLDAAAVLSSQAELLAALSAQFS